MGESRETIERREGITCITLPLDLVAYRGFRDNRGRILQGFDPTHYIMLETLLAIGDLPDADLYTAEMPDWLGEG